MEIIFVCYGDSTNASTWSNVPYLMTKTFEEKGVTVRRINIQPSHFLDKLWNRLMTRGVLRLKYPGNIYTFNRSRLFKYLTDRKIKKAATRYPDADYFVFSCFDFYNRWSDTPSILFGDWSFRTLIEDRLGRRPFSIEERFCRQQQKAINESSCSISLFLKCTESMKQACPNADIRHLGQNVINNMYDGPLDAEEIIYTKEEEKKILFIGRKSYIEGARLTISAFEHLHKQYPALTLDIIGLKDSDFSHIPQGVRCHGFLHKENVAERNTYYDLLKKATVIVNPTEKWAGFSSLVEAMYFYTPVVTSPFDDFVEEFGSHISFGHYNKEFDYRVLSHSISKILSDNNYRQYCIDAHSAVSSYTWNNYVDKMLAIMKGHQALARPKRRD